MSLVSPNLINVNDSTTYVTGNGSYASMKHNASLICDSLQVGVKTSKYFHTVDIKFYDFVSGVEPKDALVFETRFSYVDESSVSIPDFVTHVYENYDKIQAAIDEHNKKTIQLKFDKNDVEFMAKHGLELKTSESPNIKFKDLQRQWDRVGSPLLIKE